MKNPVGRTTTVVFPFDAFGNAGTGAGAELLGDVLQEIQADTHRETRTTRPAVYRDRLTTKEFHFDTPADLQSWRTTGRTAARKALSGSEFVLWLGGNHLSVLPLFEELTPETLVLQFDAHLDVYNLYDCTPTLSHGNFLLHADAPLPRLVNVGSRDLFLTPRYLKRTFETVHPADRIHADFDAVLDDLRTTAGRAAAVWLDIDADVFDPVVLPAVCQPMPFGLSAQQFLAIVSAVWGPNVRGVSISEYCPGRDVRDAGLNLLGWLLEWMLLRHYER